MFEGMSKESSVGPNGLATWDYAALTTHEMKPVKMHIIEPMQGIEEVTEV
jgi:hypothetical protein